MTRKSGDSVYDVIVIGAGPAGMAAADAARNAGARVAVIERLERLGGNAVISTGYMAFVDTELQRELGIDDSVEQFLADARVQVEILPSHWAVIWDERITRRYAEESAETFDLLRSEGVAFSRFIPRPRQHSALRMLGVEDPGSIGRAFERRLAAPGIDILFATEVRGLIGDARGVHGVRVRGVAGGPERELVASAGVVLATGGFQGNQELRRRYGPDRYARTPHLGVSTCTGTGHVIGAEVGGDLIDMGCLTPVIIVGSRFIEEAIAVDPSGRRFHDEAGPYGERVLALETLESRTAYYIFDDRTARDLGYLIDQMPGRVTTAESVAQLAAALDIDGTGLEATVAEWNAMLESGDARVDPFSRKIFPGSGRGIVSSPFHAIPMTIGNGFTWGGFTVTEAMQVVSVAGHPIPGLYAAGDTVGGINVCSPLGGVHIASALSLGRGAGRAAADGIQVSPHTASPLDPEPISAASLRMGLIDALEDRDMRSADERKAFI